MQWIKPGNNSDWIDKNFFGQFMYKLNASNLLNQFWKCEWDLNAETSGWELKALSTGQSQATQKIIFFSTSVKKKVNHYELLKIKTFKYWPS